MEKFLHDLRFALRVYAKNRSFTLIAVLALTTLGLALRATGVDLTATSAKILLNTRRNQH